MHPSEILLTFKPDFPSRVYSMMIPFPEVVVDGTQASKAAVSEVIGPSPERRGELRSAPDQLRPSAGAG
jgi:hypothetical protein